MTTTDVPSFDVPRWVREHLPREAGSMVDRITLMALGSASGPTLRYVLVPQLTETTGFSESLVENVITEGIERGEVRRDGRKVWPVQAPLVIRDDIRRAA